MNTHKGEKEFRFIKEQLGTISFMCNKGNGISAADVGVGKTVIGESVTVNQIKTGRSKRPLVCVPKAVYKKWVKEFHQHFPKMVINELGNFSDKDIARFKNDKGGLKIPKGTISVCTYEALEKVTFKDETINTSLIDDMMDSQTIYDSEAQEKRTAKELAEERNKIMTKLGKGAKAKDGAICWEDTGFDCITVDEIHNFKNVFGEARSFSGSNKNPDDSKGQANEFSGLKGSQPADRAVKLFAITQLIQKQNNGRNVFGLSATPFTNSPIEVYNILSLVARNKLKELRIYNMHEFLAQFAEIRTEWSVVANGEIKEKQVMKNWKNLGALQNLVSEYMYRVDADEAGVIRPRKIVHTPQLELTPLQRAMIKAETQYMSDADPKEDPGAALKAINYMRMATLSPAAVNPDRLDFYRKNYPKLFNGLEFPTSKDFVSASPKMTFICDTVAKVYKKKSDIGQYIYLPRGVNDFVHVKQYLMDQGMPMDSIAFMSSKTTLDEKERIKNEFNDPSGKIKVIIGSETIKEGVSLNGNTAIGYNSMLGWNPTDTTQVEGRGWRQGNKQGKFHMVYPLMADSIDALMYQKYDEKKSRIDEVWSYKGDTSRDVSDINPEELKFDLIKDPAKKAKLIVGQKLEKVRGDIRIEQARYDSIFKDSQRLKENTGVLSSRKRIMDEDEAEMLDCRENRDTAQKEYEKARKSGSSQELYQVNRKLQEAKWQLERANSAYRQAKKRHKECQDAIDSIHSKFNKLDIKPDRVDEKLKEIASGIQKLKSQEKSINESYSEELAKAARELEAQRDKIPPLKTLIDENVESIMNDLHPMDDKFKAELKAELEAKRSVKKSLVILNKRLFFKVS
jgi:exonuclease VII small subunit